MKLISLPLICLIILPSLFAFQQHNQNLAYTHPAIVVSGGVSYISVKNVDAGIKIDSPEYWTPLLSTAPSSDPGDPPTTEPDTSDSDLGNLTPPEDNSTMVVSVPSGHPNASNEAFVKQQYLDFLEREAEGTGLSDWVNILENGWDSDGDGTNDPFTRADLVNIKVSSAEYDNKIAPIVRLYFAYLGRRPESQGFADWVKYKIGQGPGEWAGREMTIEEMSQFFADAQEFIDKYGSLSDSEFVALLYTNVQGREGSADEIAAWVDILENGYNGESWNRGRVMVGFSESSEYKTKMDPEVRVYALYWGLLNRVPDDVGWDGADGPGGEKGWPDYIKEGWSPNALINGFLDSEEYLNRFNSTAPYAEK